MFGNVTAIGGLRVPEKNRDRSTQFPGMRPGILKRCGFTHKESSATKKEVVANLSVGENPALPHLIQLIILRLTCWVCRGSTNKTIVYHEHEVSTHPHRKEAICTGSQFWRIAGAYPEYSRRNGSTQCTTRVARN